jgi:hypothetical protein
VVSRSRYALLFTFMCAGAALIYFGAGPIGVAFVGVFLAGALTRDLGIFRRAAALWPITRLIIDWDRVEHLLASDDPLPTGGARTDEA